MNGYSTIVLSKKALDILIRLSDGLIDLDDYNQLVDGYRYAKDMETLDRNAVKTPLSLYK